MLARALAKPSNLLVLDEPTNDLDLETLDVLEEMLGEYSGTILLISHDRDFLDRIATSVVVPEGRGRWTEYAGGYTRHAGAARRRPRATGVHDDGRGRPPGAEDGGAAPGHVPGRPASPVVSSAARVAHPAGADRGAERADRDAAGQARRPGPVRARPGLVPVGLRRARRKGSELEAAESEWLELEILREDVGA